MLEDERLRRLRLDLRGRHFERNGRLLHSHDSHSWRRRRQRV